ncbi:MAG: hypothetical protein HDR21_08535 [Lachnospiraceae bacterium]|nr:hypothetical protein [Lachnospiraceae bacterium]
MSSKIKWFFDAVWWKTYYLIEKELLKNAGRGIKRRKFHNRRPDEVFCVIRRKGDSAGLFSYVLIILEKIEQCEQEKWIPVVDMMHTINSYLYKREVGFINSWEYFFEQPGGHKLKDIRGCQNICLSDIQIRCAVTERVFTDENDLKKWSGLYHKYIKLNEKTKKHIDDVYQELFHKSDRVLGVLCRGTDYLNAPPLHPIQPEPQMVISDAKKLMKEKALDKIYLATEDAAIYDLFRQEFGQNLIAVDCVRYVGKEEITTRKNRRKNDKYIQGLDYITTIYLLARCTGILCGNTNGAVAAYIINGGKYEFSNCYQLGAYS